MKKIIDLTGKKIGRLKIIKEVERKNKYSRVWLCKCDCGNYKEVLQADLMNGNTKSCGCYQKEFLQKCRTKHNKRHTKIYHIFAGIKRRCFNKNDKIYHYYGGRGITICDEWLDKDKGFMNFYNWAMENGYRDGLTIDRIDVNGNYEPSNCRWVDMKVQSNNRRSNKIIEINNEKHTLVEWRRINGVSSTTYYRRIKKGMSVEKALTIPTKKYNRK